MVTKIFFPALQEYKCYGSFLNKVISEKIDSKSIGIDQSSEIMGFASTAMVETFRTGVSFDVFGFVSRAFQDALGEFVETLKNQSDDFAIDDIDKHVGEIREKFNKAWYFQCLNAHWDPLKRVVGILSIDEMAELAETLINLEALKERVTKPTESVGGPVDVATITKDEGFVWIKRKHFFPAELNPRYFARRFR